MRALLPLALILAIASSATSEGCEITTSIPEVSILGQYVDNDVCQPECLISVWWYTESNDIEGLQRNDDVVDNTCGGMIEADTVVF